MHTWLPDAAAESPPGGAVLLVGVLDKVGTFGMIRFCLPLFPDASQWATPVVITLAVIGILYGALLAIGQTDMKRLIAYTSISPLRLHRAGHLRDDDARASPARRSTWSTTASRPPRCSSSPAS